MQHKEIKFASLEFKDDAGEFIGTAAVYGNVDRGGDVIVKGAFAKTIQENGGKVPLMLDHRTPIGISEISDSEDGLKNRSVMNLDKPLPRETYSDLKFYQQHGKPYGMSIGYSSVKENFEGSIRYLKEIELYEVSLTLMPMNPRAMVDSVKSEEFAAFMEEIKSGRRLSAATLARMQELLDSQETAHAKLISEFRALMASQDEGKTVNGTSDKSEAANTAGDAAATQHSIEPEAIHSALHQYQSKYAEVARWNN